jgi:hypothetical protein
MKSEQKRIIRFVHTDHNQTKAPINFVFETGSRAQAARRMPVSWTRVSNWLDLGARQRQDAEEGIPLGGMSVNRGKRRMKFIVSLGLAIAIFWTVSPQVARAANCGIDFQHAYESGVRDGRADGAHLYEYNPMSHGRKVAMKWGERGTCYRQGYDTGYQNAAADARKRPSRPSHDNAPTPGSNERAYYDDGCHEGTGDAQMNMSMAYQRHSDMYDSRFEPYFKQGYDHCWEMFR